VLALIELDGIAARLVLCLPDLDPQHLPAVIAEAGVDAIVSDGTGPVARLRSGPPVDTPVFACRADARPARVAGQSHPYRTDSLAAAVQSPRSELVASGISSRHRNF
jgi:hypothetical protein